MTAVPDIQIRDIRKHDIRKENPMTAPYPATRPAPPPGPARPGPALPVQTAPGRPALVLAPGGPDADGLGGAPPRRAARTCSPSTARCWSAGSACATDDQVASVFRLVGGELMTEREAFAARERFPERRLLVEHVAGEPADVHAPRAELRRARSRA